MPATWGTSNDHTQIFFLQSNALILAQKLGERCLSFCAKTTTLSCRCGSSPDETQLENEPFSARATTNSWSLLSSLNVEDSFVEDPVVKNALAELLP